MERSNNEEKSQSIQADPDCRFSRKGGVAELNTVKD